MGLSKFYSILHSAVPLSNLRGYSITLQKCKRSYELCERYYANIVGVPGSGAGKGGGAGGTIRESGGGLGKYGAAKEESYFYDKQKKQLEELKKQRKDRDKNTQKDPDSP